MARLIIDEKTFDPIEIKYEGEIYTVRKITNQVLFDLDDSEEKLLEGDIKAVDSSIKNFIDIPDKVLKEMDFRIKSGILTYIKSEIQEPEQYQNLLKKKHKKSGGSNVKKL